MADPVYVRDPERSDRGSGLQNYERGALAKWIRTKKKNPATNLPADLSDIVANSELKKEITAFRAQRRIEHDSKLLPIQEK